MLSDSVDPVAMSEDAEWLSAYQTLALVRQHMDRLTAIDAIIRRAHAGMIKTRAVKVTAKPLASALKLEDLLGSDTPAFNGVTWRKKSAPVLKKFDDVQNLPTEFWSDSWSSYLTNWQTGDFSVLIDGKLKVAAYLVRFNKSDVLAMLGRDEMPTHDEPASQPPLREADENKRMQQAVLQQAIDLIPSTERQSLTANQLANELAQKPGVKSIGLGSAAIRKILGGKYPPFKKYGLKVDIC